MATRVVMPKLTDTMEEGVVLAWKKREGDSVNSGDALAEIETDKAVMDLEAFGSGTLRRVLADEGQTVKAGALIAVIGEPDEDIEPALAEGTDASQTAAPEVKPARKKDEPFDTPHAASDPAKAEAQKPESQQSGGKKPEDQKPIARKPEAQEPASQKSETQDQGEPRLKVSPRAKTIALERGIDLSKIKGSGPDGRIIERDLPEQKSDGATRAPVEAGERPLSQMRKAIARTMTQSKAPVPHFYLTTDIAMDEVERLRAQWKQIRRTHPSLTDMIVKAAALALTRHPEINVSYADDKIRQHATIDIGIAVGLDEGLITPILRNCGKKSLDQIALEAHGLIERARTRQLKPEEYTGATFSISNLGMFDVENFIAVLVPPEAAAIAVGKVRDVAVPEGSGVNRGRRMKVTLSCDHRALDGMQGAKFLGEFKRILERPLELVLPEEDR
ncbi:MAG TPA: dihydrolipoamide acetyltransferase family protein [Nitrospiraceae bacterium]|nr:dihydrolipoamide acetyltransferase family protein [Nitrospiraceae bacterium]